MSAYEITAFREHLDQQDPENKEIRRTFHENYEWLEGYWRSSWKNNGFQNFCNKFGKYFWEHIAELPELAREFGWLGPIGDSCLEGYEPNPKVKDATKLLQENGGNSVERFKATMLLVRQVRNNLFHGQKMELLELDVYNRNKNLIRFAGNITGLLLDHLLQAEEFLGS